MPKLVVPVLGIAVSVSVAAALPVLIVLFLQAVILLILPVLVVPEVVECESTVFSAKWTSMKSLYNEGRLLIIHMLYKDTHHQINTLSYTVSYTITLLHTGLHSHRMID